jgi:hypothetical protein
LSGHGETSCVSVNVALSHTGGEPRHTAGGTWSGAVSPQRALQGAAGMPALSGGRARCGRAQTAETGRADQATEGPRRVANIVPADGEWDEAGQHRRPDRHGECVTSRLRPCRTSVSGRRNARAHRGRRSSCTLRHGGLSIGNPGHLPDPPLWRVEEWRKRRDISLPGDDPDFYRAVAALFTGPCG